MTEPTTRPRGYIALVAAVGLGLVGAAALQPAGGTVDAGMAAVLFMAAILSVLTPIRLYVRSGVQGFNFLGAVLVAMLFELPGAAPVILLSGAALVGFALKVRDLEKVAFNVGQVAIWAAAATAVFRLIVPAETTASSLLGAAGALLVVTVVVLLNGFLLYILFVRMGTDAGRLRAVLSPLHILVLLSNSVSGLIMAVLAGTGLVGAVLGMAVLGGVFLGYRGYAGILEERGRVEHLHRLTQHLVDTTTRPAAVSDFLARVKDLFGGTHAELVLHRPSEDLRLLVPDDPAFLTRDPVGLLNGAPSYLSPDGRTAMVAGLWDAGRVLGAIAVYEREGLEPWESSDITLLRSVVNEAAVALRNRELFEQVERERARLEAESTKLADVLGAATDGIALIAGDGTIETWNPGMTKITGVAEEQAVGQPWFVVMRLRDDAGQEIMPDSDHQVAEALRGRRLDHPVLMQGMRRDGTWRWLQCTVSPVAAQGETLAGSVLVARDVTAEHEVDELKADFIATVSHELRTPLTPLKGFLMTLRRTGGDVRGHSLDRVLEAMSNQVNRLEALISDLLAVAELDSGQFDLHPEYVDLADQVAAAAEVEVGPEIADRLHLEIRQRVAAVADPLAVIRIVRALVGNAIKHTAGPVTVEIDADDDRAFVRVIDTGPGIPPWEQNRIFGRFERLGDHLQRTQGPGLGLTIARALAHRMQGDVTIESDVGTGSTFTLVLPVARRPRLRLASSE